MICDIDLNPASVVVRQADGGASCLAYGAPEAEHYRGWYTQVMEASKKMSGDADFSLSLDGLRWRASVYEHLDGVTASLRRLPNQVRPLVDLGFVPETILSLFQKAGLIVFAGPTGAGKSATMAACIQALSDAGLLGKAICIESPIEYVYDSPLIHQREVGPHVASFADGIVSAMRQFPQTLVIGEIRTPDAAAVAVDAAFSGHRVLATLHADSAGGAIERLWSLLDDQHDEMLPSALQGVMTQHLLRLPEGVFPVWETLAIDDPCRAVLAQGAQAIPQLAFHQKRQQRPQLHECALLLRREGVPVEMLARWL